MLVHSPLNCLLVNFSHHRTGDFFPFASHDSPDTLVSLLPELIWGLIDGSRTPGCTSNLPLNALARCQIMALAPCRTMPPHPPLMGSILSLCVVSRDKPWREWHDVGSMRPETAWSMFKMFNMFSCETAISKFLHPMFQVAGVDWKLPWFGAGMAIFSS